MDKGYKVKSKFRFSLQLKFIVFALLVVTVAIFLITSNHQYKTRIEISKNLDMSVSSYEQMASQLENICLLYEIYDRATLKVAERAIKMSPELQDLFFGRDWTLLYSKFTEKPKVSVLGARYAYLDEDDLVSANGIRTFYLRLLREDVTTGTEVIYNVIVKYDAENTLVYLQGW